MPKSTLLWTTRTPANRAALRLEFVRFFRLNRWLTYLIGVPLIVAVALLATFFFAAFLGLIAAVLAIAALRVWWLRCIAARIATKESKKALPAVHRQ